MVSEGSGMFLKSLLRDFSLSLTPSVLCLFGQPWLSCQVCDVPRSGIHSCFPRFPQLSDLIMMHGCSGKVMYWEQGHGQFTLHPGLQLPGE